MATKERSIASAPNSSSPSAISDGAERSYDAALEASRRRQARQWELRAASGLALLLADRGEVARARAILGETYGWFTEGFDAPDLKRAREILDDLA